MTIDQTRQKIENIRSELSSQFVERDEEIHGLTLSILCDANVLLLGKPGVGKSDMVETWRKHITESNYFSCLLSQFTVPEDLAGPTSVTKLQEDRYVTNTQGRLPEAHLATLEEIWRGNSGVIDFLLPILNERKFFNEGKFQDIPLLTLVGTSNNMPQEGEGLAAAVDRFILKYEVKDVTEQSNFIKMMRGYVDGPIQDKTKITLDEIHQAREHVYNIPIGDGILNTIYKIVKKLGSKNIRVSGRTVNQSLRVIQANAFMRGGSEVQEQDLSILKHIYWNQPEQFRKVQSEILEITSPDEKELHTLLSEAEAIFEEQQARPSDDIGSTEATSQLVQSLNKIKRLATKINKIKTDIEKKGKDSSLATEYLKKVISYSEELAESNYAIDYKQLGSI